MTPSATAVVAPLSAPHDDSALLLQKAERYFLQKKYKEALFSVNQALVRLQRHHDNASKNIQRCDHEDVILLSPPLRQYSFCVSLKTNRNNGGVAPTASHQLAAIGLQSWHELSSKEASRTERSRSARKSPPKNSIDRNDSAMKHLEPILNYFSLEGKYLLTESDGECNFRGSTNNMETSRTLTMDIFLVWVHFWESHGYQNEMFSWTYQTLISSCRSLGEPAKGTSGRNMPDEKLETLWIHFVVQQLPRLKDADIARQLLQAVSMDPTAFGGLNSFPVETLTADMNQELHSEDFCPETVRVLVNTLQTMGSSPIVDAETSSQEEVASSGCMISSESVKTAIESLSKWHQSNGKTSASTRRDSHAVDVATALPNGDSRTNLEEKKVPDELRNRVRNSYVQNNIVNLAPPTHYLRLQQTRIFQWISNFIPDNLLRNLDSINLHHRNANYNDAGDLASVERRRRLQTMAVSLAFLLLSWRQRKFLSRVGKSVAMVLLAPIRELVDALIASDSGSGSGAGRLKN